MIRIEDWTEETISELSDNKAAEFIRAIIKSPYFDGYLAVLTTIININAELQGGASKIESDDEGADKSFERSHKYITEMQPYYDQLEYFRSKLLPQEIVETEEKAADLLDEARLKMKNRNGKG